MTKYKGLLFCRHLAAYPEPAAKAEAAFHFIATRRADGAREERARFYSISLCRGPEALLVPPTAIPQVAEADSAPGIFIPGSEIRARFALRPAGLRLAGR